MLFSKPGSCWPEMANFLRIRVWSLTKSSISGLRYCVHLMTVIDSEGKHDLNESKYSQTNEITFLELLGKMAYLLCAFQAGKL